MADPKFKAGDKVSVPFREATSTETRRVPGEVEKYMNDAVLVKLPFGIAVLYDEKDVHG